MAAPAIALESLDRDELLALITKLGLFRITAHDLWGARWNVLSRRTLAAMEAASRTSSAYHDQLVAFAASGLTIQERDRRAARAKRLKSEWMAAERIAKRLEAQEREAWAALEAGWARNTEEAA